MKSPVAKLLPALQAEVERAREMFAEEALRPEMIREACFEAAHRGELSLRKRLPDFPGVRGTRAEATLATWCKGQGLVLTWEKRMADLPDGRRVDVWEPEISWRVRE